MVLGLAEIPRLLSGPYRPPVAHTRPRWCSTSAIHSDASDSTSLSVPMVTLIAIPVVMGIPGRSSRNSSSAASRSLRAWTGRSDCTPGRCRLGSDAGATASPKPFVAGSGGYACDMWLFLSALIFLVIGIVGSIFSGGIFTIVIIPIGLIALVTAAGSSMSAWSAQRKHGGGPTAGSAEPRPLPSSNHHNIAPAPSSPADLVDARREQQ